MTVEKNLSEAFDNSEANKRNNNAKQKSVNEQSELAQKEILSMLKSVNYIMLYYI